MKIKILVFLSLCIMLTGCSSPRAGQSYMVENIKETHLKGLTDAQALEMFRRIYETPVDDPIDQSAKDITITAFLNAFRSMRSPEIRSSDVLKIKHKRVDLRKWNEQDLTNTYQGLDARLRRVKKKVSDPGADDEKSLYWSVQDFSSAPALPEDVSEKEKENTPLTIIRLTAMYSVGDELSQRGETAKGWSVFKSSLGLATSIAARAAMLLAGFIL
ncbi:MAG: hypothetical protein P9L88_01150 [Candidatus Tantalella remota]|nr:hypothetical protein [Candidatus Tantalella remota]